MKTGIFSIAVISLLHVAAAQPYARLHHKHAKRQPVGVKVITDVDYVTVDAADVIVYVDPQGKPESTSTIYHNQAGPTKPPSQPPAAASSAVQTSPAYHQPPPAPPPQHGQPQPQPQPHPKPSAPAPAPVNSPPPQAPPPPPSPKPAPPPPPPPPPPAPAPPKSSPVPSHPSPPPKPSQPSSPSSSGPGFGSAISYSPYNADNSCKSYSQVANDFAKINGYEVIRLYGTDCNQVANVIAATKGKGLTLFLGIFDINQVQSECQTIISAVNGDWSVVNTISVGNELVNDGGASVGQVTGAIGQARSILKAAGYNGPVVTVDTMIAMKANPELCTASDFCAINCHAFFDGNTPAEKSGEFVANWVKEISQAAGGKTTVVTETGWPSQGQTNKLAVPSQANQQAAIASIKQSLATNVILYSSFNDMWKKNTATTFGAEQYWGILGMAPSG